jgi:hypothetical protein
MLVIFFPAAAGIKGYRAVARFPSAPEAQEVAKLLWTSRQFLGVAIAAYVAIITIVVFLTEVVYKR